MANKLTLDVGKLEPAAWYHVLVIDTEMLAALVVLSASTAGLPGVRDLKSKRVLSFKTDGEGAIITPEFIEHTAGIKK